MSLSLLAPDGPSEPVTGLDAAGRFHVGARTRAVLLDVDGVLSDHRTAADTASYRWAAELSGWTLGPEETSELWEAVDRKHFDRYQRGETTYDGQLRARVREVVPGGEDLGEGAVQAHLEAYFAHYRSLWVPYEDVADFIARLRSAAERRSTSSRPLAVAYLTNGDEVTQRDKLDAVGALVDGWPVLASAQLGVTKPDPRAFALACAHLGVAPGEALMVGDDVRSDVDGAGGAGVPCVHLRRGRSGPSREVPTVTSLGEIVLD